MTAVFGRAVRAMEKEGTTTLEAEFETVKARRTSTERAMFAHVETEAAQWGRRFEQDPLSS